MLSGRGLCDELITCPEESYRLRCVVVCDLETSRMGAPYIYIYIYIYDISRLRVNLFCYNPVKISWYLVHYIRQIHSQPEYQENVYLVPNVLSEVIRIA